MCKLTVSKEPNSDMNTLVNLTLEINQISSLYNVDFEIYGITNTILISIITNKDCEEAKTFNYCLDRNDRNEYSLEFLIKLLKEILKTNIKYKDLVNESEYDINTFIKYELENVTKAQEMYND